MKEAINETGINVGQNQNLFTHMKNGKEINEENLASCLTENVPFMQRLIETLTDALLTNKDFHPAVELQLEQKVNEKVQKVCEKMNAKIQTLEENYEDLAQYSRRNCLLLHGLMKTPMMLLKIFLKKN